MQVDNTSHWYAIHTHPKQENRAASNLQAWQVETFAPWRRGRQLIRSATPTYMHRALFPGYIFARFNAQELLHKIRYTRGVHSVVSVGMQPAIVDDELIMLIQARRNEGGYVLMSGELQRGDEVLIKEGIFKGFVGIFERQIKDSDRVTLLLKAVAHKSHVTVSIDHLEQRLEGH
jgi:transcriptional antiterminator RfaH